jgi:excisionase family DNA binding protein
VVERAIAPSVLAALADTPVVVLNGARQVGKTTLVARLDYPSSTEVVTLDDAANRDAARDDPRAFVSRPVDTLVVDEAQLEPGLFRAIKSEVDRYRRPGRFLLTGYLLFDSSLVLLTDMRIGEAAEYLGMSVVGVRKAAEEGRLPCRRSASGQRLFDRADLDAYLGRPVPVADAGGRDRVEALYCRVSGLPARSRR